jgi:hypothetical protein
MDEILSRYRHKMHSYPFHHVPPENHFSFERGVFLFIT